MTKKQLEADNERLLMAVDYALSALVAHSNDLEIGSDKHKALYRDIQHITHMAYKLDFAETQTQTNVMKVVDTKAFVRAVFMTGSGWTSMDDVPLAQQRAWRDDPSLWTYLGIAKVEKPNA